LKSHIQMGAVSSTLTPLPEQHKNQLYETVKQNMMEHLLRRMYPDAVSRLEFPFSDYLELPAPISVNSLIHPPSQSMLVDRERHFKDFLWEVYQKGDFIEQMKEFIDSVYEDAPFGGFEDDTEESNESTEGDEDDLSEDDLSDEDLDDEDLDDEDLDDEISDNPPNRTVVSKKSALKASNGGPPKKKSNTHKNGRPKAFKNGNKKKTQQ